MREFDLLSHIYAGVSCGGPGADSRDSKSRKKSELSAIVIAKSMGDEADASFMKIRRKS